LVPLLVTPWKDPAFLHNEEGENSLGLPQPRGRLGPWVLFPHQQLLSPSPAHTPPLSLGVELPAPPQPPLQLRCGCSEGVHRCPSQQQGLMLDD